jgi:hypothetical protein
MHTAPKKIIVNPNSEVARLLDEAADRPLLLEKDGVRYRLDREETDIWAGYDPEAAIEGIRAAAGSWKDIDAEVFKAYIRERRKASSRPPVSL